MYYSNLTLKDLKGIKKLSKIIKPIFSVKVTTGKKTTLAENIVIIS